MRSQGAARASIYPAAAPRPRPAQAAESRSSCRLRRTRRRNSRAWFAQQIISISRALRAIAFQEEYSEGESSAGSEMEDGGRGEEGALQLQLGQSGIGTADEMHERATQIGMGRWQFFL